MDLDLNINNYKFNEIEDFFRLRQPYSLHDVLKNEKQILNVIIQDKKFQIERKTEFIDFMKKAKNRLIEKLRETLEQEIESDNELEEDGLLIQSDVGKVVNQTTAVQMGGNSFVQNQETTSFNEINNPAKYLNPLETYPTNIARSYLNNLKRKTITQTVILNSLFREDYKNTSSTDFNLVLPYQFKNVLSLRLSSIQLPNVLYCFSSKKMNNMMYIAEHPTDGTEGRCGSIILPDGNYSLQELAKVLENTINGDLEIDPPRFEVTGHESTQKIMIRNSKHVFSMNFLKDVESIDFNSTLGWTIGFRQIEYFCSAVYITESIYNSVASDYIFFVLNDFNHSQSQNILAMYSKSYIGNNILAMIPLTSRSFHICFDNGTDFIEKKRDYFGPVNLQRLKIELRNQFGELLDLNGMDFSFSLEVELGYDW
jgi:hypothetical protein